MNQKAVGFIRFLRQLDRKGFADLRRSLGQPPGLSMQAIPYVERFAVGEASDWNRQMYYLVAGLFCLVERPGEPSEVATPVADIQSNLGEALGALYVERDQSSSIEQRFIRLLDADAQQLPDRLRQTLTLIRSYQIPVMWEQLLEDLCFWNRDDRSVQHRWARSFYLRSQGNQQEETTATNGGNV